MALAVRAWKVRPAIACAQIDIILLDALLAAASDDERGAWTDWLSPGPCRGSRTVWGPSWSPLWIGSDPRVAKLARLGTPGPGQPAWAALMARKRRKTLVVCHPCHEAIHATPVTDAA